jgi:hypothetical protein
MRYADLQPKAMPNPHRSETFLGFETVAESIKTNNP